MQKYPLYMYVIGVAVVWAVILGFMWVSNPASFGSFALICGGFALGMLAMYLAVHIYTWK